MSVIQAGRTELSGADWFLVSVEQMMRASGQGEHAGLTVLRLGPGFEIDALRSAAARLAEASPIAAARLRKPILGVPRWQWNGNAHANFPVSEERGTWENVGVELLNAMSESPVKFVVLPEADGRVTVLVRWRHSLLDGKGVELFLAEIARLADEKAEPSRENSWGPPAPRTQGWRAFAREAEKFKDHFYELSKLGIRSLGGTKAKAAEARFFVEEFSIEETARIAARAEQVTHGVFQMGWFLSATMRMHLAVLEQRGETAESFQSGCAVQQRKRGARHPIWQNQVSQLFFHMLPAELADHASAARRLNEQFGEQTRQRLDAAFAAMTRLFRRLPSRLYLRMLLRNSGGHITSFFFSHTGEFLPECKTFCGAAVEDGWHIPSVSQPPGTGVFFSQRGGKLAATISWREESISNEELELMRSKMREDLLGI